MDFCNVSVGVLYDFEYTTKYGRNIKISSGERLLLIKKTNNDWWQVIRSSEQRPFFVPASYVEIMESSKKDQSRIKCSSYTTNTQKDVCTSNLKEHLKNNTDTTTKEHEVFNSNLSLPTLEKPAIVSDLKGEIINTSNNKTGSCTMSSSGYNSFCEEIPVLEEEDPSYSLIDDSISNSQHGSKSHAGFDSRQCEVVDESPVSDSVLSEKINNCFNTSFCEVLENKLYKCAAGDKYSTINDPMGCSSEVSNLRINHALPASDSLENLSLQIELKTSSLRNTTNTSNICVGMNKNSIYSSSDNACSQNNYLSANNFDGEICSVEGFHNISLQNKYKDSRSNENVCSAADNNNLHYHGSFKTNSERQRWLKKSSSEKQQSNGCSYSEESVRRNSTSTRESAEDVSANEDSCIVVSSSKEGKIQRKIDNNLQQSEFREKVLQKKLCCYGSDSQLTHLNTFREKTSSHHSLDSVDERELRESYSEQLKQTKLSYPSIPQINSEKSSTDSLLEIENNRKDRKISGGTTSDSLIPTDGEDLVTSDSETDSVKQEQIKNVCSKTRKIPLTRRRRVLVSKSRLDVSKDPPSPAPSQEPTRVLIEGWNEYDSHDGHKYFYNLLTKEKRWKPPRRNNSTNVEIQEEYESNASAVTDDLFVVNLPLPKGWRSEIDPVTSQTCYINITSGAKWYSSTDNEGRVYFFEENSNKSSWTLPDSQNNNEDDILEDIEDKNILSAEKSLNRNVKSKSLILATRLEESNYTNISQNWPQLWDGTMCILKEGPLNKTKITENGKRLRKNWTSTHAVLTELLLLFFKDNKGFPSMMSGNGRPELSVDLNGATVDPGDKVSSRKNVHMLSTVLGLQVLIQCDCQTNMEQWLQAIQEAISNLPSSCDAKGLRTKSESPLEEVKTAARIGRSKSMKLKQKSASTEDMAASMAERQTKIKERLKKFFHRRPTVDLLVKKGIWKDEPVFGCLLEQACPTEPPRVPLFVQHCIHCIERSEENMKTDGLYRASGNLSQVQKIRLQVDQNIYTLLEQEEDVHVLAGTLKLFFRELKQPVIPFKFFNKALNACTNANRAEKIKDFREIVKSLPTCNYDTLKLLLQHLLRVTKYHEYNRMHIPNIAIVFGPTLMWPEQESLNMAFDLMQQNLVIECFLSDFHLVFQ